MDAATLELVKTIPPLPRRANNANKGDCGKVIVIAGSRGMAGAPCLAARAAYRGGAGLVRAVVPESIWDVVASKLDESTTAGLSATKSGAFSSKAAAEISEHAKWADVAVMGPGMSQDPETLEFIQTVVAELDRPIVLDADGLNAFAGKPEQLKTSAPKAPPVIAPAASAPAAKPAKAPRGKAAKAAAAAAAAAAPPPAEPAPPAADNPPVARRLVLTPHPGEMARLLGNTVGEVQADRRAAALKCAELTGAVVVLKGAGTLVCNGTQLYENRTGNAGMATGGSGDVLTGLIAALIGQSMTPFDAACLGVYLHGMAGDIAIKRVSIWSLIAGDIVDELPAAFLTHAKATGAWF